MSTYANNYTVWSIDFYPSTPSAQTLQQCIQIAATTQALAEAELLVDFPNAVIVSVTPDTDSSASVVLPDAVSGTTSPASLYSVDFYPSAPTGSIGTAGTSSYQVEQNNVLQLNMQVLANTVAQAEAIVVNYYPSAVILAVGSVTETIPGAVAIQTA